jgi:hypothetical protein
MQKVRIFLTGDTAHIKFRYNPDVVEIMHEFYTSWNPLQHVWTTNARTAKDIFNKLKEQSYDVKMIRVK